MARSSSAPTKAPSSFFAPRKSTAKASNGNGSDKTKAFPPTGQLCHPPRQLPPLASGASWRSKIRFLTPNRSSWILHIPRFCRSFPKHQQYRDRTERTPILSFDEMWKTHPDQQHSLVLFGRKVLENRYSTMYAKDETVGNYTYSGSSRVCKVCDASQPHENFILKLFASVDAIAGELLSPTGSIDQPKGKAGFFVPSPETAPTSIYNACLVNWYAPDHTIGLHSDDEAELDTSWPIFSLSWGGPRRFLLRPKSKHIQPKQRGVASPKGVVHEVLLKDGDLLVMGGKCQEEFKHEIPKVRSTRDGLVGNRISWTIRRMRPNTKKAATMKSSAQAGMHKSSTSGAREKGKINHYHHRQYRHNEKVGVTKRTRDDVGSEPSNDQVTRTPHRPRKKAAIYNPYARARD